MHSPVQSASLRWAFAASVIAFGGGLTSLPVLFGQGPSGFCAPAWACMIAYGIFPYIPSVFGPVVLLQATFFFLISTHIDTVLARIGVVLGSSALAAVAIVGLLVQTVLLRSWTAGLPLELEAIVWSLAGLTSIGYAIIYAALRGRS